MSNQAWYLFYMLLGSLLMLFLLNTTWIVVHVTCSSVDKQQCGAFCLGCELEWDKEYVCEVPQSGQHESVNKSDLHVLQQRVLSDV